MKHILIVLVLAVFSMHAMAFEPEFNAMVVSVVDGNTVEIESKNERVRLMLADVDSPELGQEFGEQAKKFLEKKLLRKEVKVMLKGKDRRGNQLAVVYFDDEDIRVDLLKEGLAWTAEKNPDPQLEPYKQWAMQKSRGLWKIENPTPPWTYRRQQSMLSPKSS